MKKLSLINLLENAGGNIVLYHGTQKTMNKPDQFFMKVIDFGPGMYFATKPEGSIRYGSVIYRADVTLNNPIVVGGGVPADPSVVARLLRGLRISQREFDEQHDGVNEFVTIFTLAKLLIDLGEISAKSFQSFLMKIGYDGVIVKNDILRKTNSVSGDYDGDYVAVFSPSQIHSWDPMKGPEYEEMMRNYYTRK